MIPALLHIPTPLSTYFLTSASVCIQDINEFLTNELKARSLTTSAMEAKVVELYHLLDDVNKKHEVRDLS